MEHVPSIDLIRRALPDIEIVDFIDSGGFKAVFKVIVGKRREALKMIYIPKDEEDPEGHAEVPQRIKLEIDSLARCSSQYLVKLGSIPPREIEISGYKYILYSEEFLEGRTIKNRIRELYRPTFSECKLLLTCLIDVVCELKDLNLIHRDIKPANVMELNIPERPYAVLDLGIAFKIGSTAITINPDLRLGTLPYMAPEIFEPGFRETLNHRSDLYSAAVTVYEYSSGVHPVARRREDHNTTVYRILNNRPTPLSEFRPDFPRQFCTLIDRLMHKMPALRPNIATISRTMEGL